MQRGVLNGARTALTSETFAQCWSLDATGNWHGMKEAATGGAWTLEQARTANPVNEITDVSNAVGPAWAIPAYDPAGNLTTIPKPNDPAEAFTATYDPWNRLVKLEEDNGSEGPLTVQENQYDGRRFRTIRKDYEEGDPAETRHFYYTAGWQDIEERLGADPDEADADRQFVWGLRYIDDCIFRDSNTNGTLDERHYALQDANWNVDAIANSAGEMQERFSYSAYGTPTSLTSAFVPGSATGLNWSILYFGTHYDIVAAMSCVRNRHYVSHLGNWLQRDALGSIAGSNLYAAIFIINGVDPYGLLGKVASSSGCESICTEVAKDPALVRGGGGAFCFCGEWCIGTEWFGYKVKGCVRCACLFDAPEFGIVIGRCPEADKCGIEHEMGHFRQIDPCDPSKPGVSRPDFKAGLDVTIAECEQRKAEIKCLEKSKAKDPMGCKRTSQRVIDTLQKWMNDNC